MSRSYKKSYIKFSDSDKIGKITANKKFRKISKKLTKYFLNENIEDTDEDPNPDILLKNPPKRVREVYDIWSFPSDGGAIYVHDKNPKWNRK